MTIKDVKISGTATPEPPKTEVAVKQETAVAVVPQGAWGAAENIESSDLLVPKIFHQQALSQFVTDGMARAGDFCDSLTGEVLAKKEDKLEVIVFGTFKSMVTSKLDGKGKYQFESSALITPDNAHEYIGKPFMEDINGESYKNSLIYNFYCLLPGKIKELPYVLSCGSSKTKTAKRLNTMLMKLAQLNMAGASFVFDLTSIVEKNDQGSWFGLEVKQGRKTTADEMATAYKWYTKSKMQNLVVADSEESDSAPF